MTLHRSIRSWGRRKYDSCFCKTGANIDGFGEISSWNVFTSCLDQNSIIYSGGVGHDISFEKALISRFHFNVHLFDPSPTGIATMELAENRNPKIHFNPIGIAGESTTRRFSPPVNELEGSFRLACSSDVVAEFKCKDLLSLMKERGHSSIDLLKIDIEGFEYEVIDNIIRQSINIKQICVEFHHFFEYISLVETLKAIVRLNASGFGLIYKKRFDYTFLRKT